MRVPHILYIYALRGVLWIVTTFLFLPTEAQNNAHLSTDTSQWYNKTHQIQEITVSKKRERYRRKNNPAVQLMRRVIARRDSNSAAHHNYYSCRKYQKLTFSANEVTPEQLQSGALRLLPGAAGQVETCPYNGKKILPLATTETMTSRVYRKQPRALREIVLAERNSGIGNLFRSGDLLNDAMRDFFTNVDIYDEDIRLLQHTLLSPIANRAISFYHYFIIDTVLVQQQPCVHLFFRPANSLDHGFSGELYVMADNSYRVRRCHLSIPKVNTVNFVKRLDILQEYGEVEEGEWLPVQDDMVIELSVHDFLQQAILVRNTRMDNYSFSPLADSLFSRGHVADERRLARQQGKDYWEAHRPIALTGAEQRMDAFMEDIQRSKRLGWMRTAVSLLVENYVETAPRHRKNRVDIGPVSSIISANEHDGLRTRIGGQTTALLHPQLFFEGYYAHGWRSRAHYYSAGVTYSLRKKEYFAESFPVRSISFSSANDVCSPADRFLSTDKDNMFLALKWTKHYRQVFFNKQQLCMDREEQWGLRTTLTLTAEKQQPVVSEPHIGGMRTTSLSVALRYAPGETTVETKTKRRPLNLDAPVLTLSHTMGFKGLLGGEHRYHITEASAFRRFWLNSWGKLDVRVKGGMVWNRVPVLLLQMAPSNLSYITRHGTFSLVGDMEYLMDRYAVGHLTWDLNGKLFNRVPGLRLLKWREFVGVRGLWGTLSDRNRQPLPAGSTAPDPHKPYIEVVAGVHNVLRFFHIEYVRRLTYTHTEVGEKQGVRFKASVKF